MNVEIARAEGVYLYGPDGKQYLDLISGIGVSNVGHNAEEVVQAVCDQAKSYMHAMVYGEFILSPQVQYAELLTKHLNDSLDTVFFVNSGSEAVEGSLKLAKKFTGRSKLLSFKNSYHGSTHGALSVTGSPELKKGYGDFLPGVSFGTFNDPGTLEHINETIAAVIIEPIQAEAGMVTPGPGFLSAMRKKCNETGTILIFDESQTGFGRTGSLFAHQHYKVKPDILVLSKALGGGMPLGAFISSRKIMQVLQKEPVLGHITTFGGHPVSCAAGLAALTKILNEDLIATVQEKSVLIRNKLRHQAIKAIHGTGLMLAAEVGSFDLVQEIIHKAIKHGVITDWFLHNNVCIRIAPPLTISNTELEAGIDLLLLAIEEAYNQP